MGTNTTPASIDLTQFLIRFEYDRDNGVFRYRHNFRNNLAGDVCGNWDSLHNYRKIFFKDTRLPAHRVVFAMETGRWTANEIIHLDGDKDNNRFDNLCEIINYKDPIDVFEYDYENDCLVFKVTSKTYIIGQPANTCINNVGYHVTAICNKMMTIHKIIWRCIHGEVPTGLCIDHMDRNRLNNHPKNLRVVTYSSNCQNSTQNPSNNVNNAPGTKPIKKGKYQSSIMVNGKSIWLGQFKTIEEASRAYQDAKLEFHDVVIEDTIIDYPDFIVTYRGKYIGTYPSYEEAKIAYIDSKLEVV